MNAVDSKNIINTSTAFNSVTDNYQENLNSFDESTNGTTVKNAEKILEKVPRISIYHLQYPGSSTSEVNSAQKSAPFQSKFLNKI